MVSITWYLPYEQNRIYLLYKISKQAVILKDKRIRHFIPEIFKK